MKDHYLRKAKIQDVKSIHRLLMECSRQDLLLPRSFNDLYSRLRDFFVVSPKEQDKDIVGCCALAICWEDLAEIRSLAVDETARNQGLGANLVEAALSEAVTLGLFRVFTLTYRVHFFQRLGFVETPKDKLPQKVWADCLNCPKFPECDETAMLIEL